MGQAAVLAAGSIARLTIAVRRSAVAGLRRAAGCACSFAGVALSTLTYCHSGHLRQSTDRS